MAGFHAWQSFDNAIKMLEDCARDAKDEPEFEKSLWLKIRELKRKRAVVFANLLLDDRARFE